MFAKVVLLSSCLAVCLAQTVLLPGGRSVSHHSKTVSDATSTVHRHHTQAHNNPVQLVRSNHAVLAPNPLVTRTQSLSSPSLLQHADGRFFALNANLVPGQVFQTADGRFFTLAGDGDQAAAAPAADAAAAEEDNVVIARESAPTTTPAPRTTAAPTMAPRTTAAPATSAPQRSADASVIATAPLTASTASFVARSPAVPTLADLRSFAAANPAQFAQFAGLRNFAPTATVTHLTHNVAPAVAVARAPLAVAAHPVAHTLTHAGPAVRLAHTVAHPIAHTVAHPAVAVAGQGGRHLLADSRTNVFTGFYTFPNAGINFDF